MYVCICHGVTERDIQKAATDGCHEVQALTMRTGAGSGCGSCLPLAQQVLTAAVADQRFPLPMLKAA